MTTTPHYQSGFHNYFSTQALAGALPDGQNSPQKPPFGLYAEQLSGSAFTASLTQNLRSWLYRILPSVSHGTFETIRAPWGDTQTTQASPQQMRWGPHPMNATSCDFIAGLQRYLVAGSLAQQQGGCVYLYSCDQAMQNDYFYNADGDWLIVPEQGDLAIHTEFGLLHIAPCEIAVIPRGIKFQVRPPTTPARGYILENWGAPFVLPEHGPIGPNSLANNRDFLAPVAAYEDCSGDYRLCCKFADQLWAAPIDHSPLDVVAWHGNYYPYKYDLLKFNTIGSISFDHPDPSIFTVLTSPSLEPGVANMDFVIFPERWMVAENTFRPPWYHRNIMSEYMGLIRGQYDAKENGFLPGGGSLHNAFSAHGPDSEGFKKATAAELKPVKYHDTLAFMFETRWLWEVTDYAANAPHRQANYSACWQGLPRQFKG